MNGCKTHPKDYKARDNFEIHELRSLKVGIDNLRKNIGVMNVPSTMQDQKSNTIDVYFDFVAFYLFFSILPRCYSKLFFETFIKVSQTAEANTVSDLTYIITFLSTTQLPVLTG